MKLTIVADDGAVGIDGVFFSDLDLSLLDPTIHAVQWSGEYGEVEFKTAFVNGALSKPSNQIIFQVDEYQFAVDAWNAAKLADDQAKADAEAQVSIPVTEEGA